MTQQQALQILADMREFREGAQAAIGELSGALRELMAEYKMLIQIVLEAGDAETIARLDHFLAAQRLRFEGEENTTLH